MDIKTANRLLEFRKKYGYSQEQLAEKLGLSRQAISKWERAEASPDTDNLVELAKLYGVTLDELVMGEDAPNPEDGADGNTADNSDDKSEKDENRRHGIHITDSDGSHIYLEGNGITFSDKDGEVNIDTDGVTIEDGEIRDGNGKHFSFEKDFHVFSYEREKRDFPTALLATILFFALGFCPLHAWHPGWMVFLCIPIVNSMIECVRKRSLSEFSYAMFAVVAFLSLGFFVPGAWAWSWIMFLTIPLWSWAFHKKED